MIWFIFLILFNIMSLIVFWHNYFEYGTLNYKEYREIIAPWLTDDYEWLNIFIQIFGSFIWVFIGFFIFILFIFIMAVVDIIDLFKKQKRG